MPYVLEFGAYFFNRTVCFKKKGATLVIKEEHFTRKPGNWPLCCFASFRVKEREVQSVGVIKRNRASFLKIPCFGQIENGLEAHRASPRRICVGFPPDPFKYLATTPQAARVCVVQCCF